MKNKYEVRGDITVIFLRRRNGEIIETIIDTVDLPIVMFFQGTWFATCDSRHHGIHYAGIKIQRVRYLLARILLDAPKGLVVDHKNHDTLDNRRSNIRIVTIAENGQNLKLCRSSTTGIRGVCYEKDTNGWRVYMQVGGKKYSKRCKTLKEAEISAIQARKDSMPFSQEAMGM